MFRALCSPCWFLRASNIVTFLSFEISTVQVGTTHEANVALDYERCCVSLTADSGAR